VSPGHEESRPRQESGPVSSTTQHGTTPDDIAAAGRRRQRIKLLLETMIQNRGKPRRASFPDAYRYAVDDLDKVVRRIEKLHGDDRFLGHREDLQQRRGDLLTEIACVVSGIESDLGGYLTCPDCRQRMVPDRSWSELLCIECRQIAGLR